MHHLCTVIYWVCGWAEQRVCGIPSSSPGHFCNFLKINAACIWDLFFFSPGKSITKKWVSNNGSLMLYRSVINGSLHPQRGADWWHCFHRTSSGVRSSVPVLAAVEWTWAVSLTPVEPLGTSPGLEPVVVDVQEGLSPIMQQQEDKEQRLHSNWAGT